VTPGRRTWLTAGLLAAGITALAAWPAASTDASEDRPPEQAAADNGTCGICHETLEDMHPFFPVTCVQCHGGDPTKTELADAHVQARSRLPTDERVLGQSFDPAYLRFVDPGNLRVAAASCGPCHSDAVHNVNHSLHATTAGHLGDGLYENGVVGERHPPVSIFDINDGRPDDAERPPGAVRGLKQIRGFTGGTKDSVSKHFADLPRKACMQCHLWSRGRAVRGRAGMDGDYRGEGCSACHVPYADDGLSLSRDQTIPHFEPGHPREHRMVRFPDTTTCTRCHYGDASIGLSFRGLAQPVPGMPQTPDAPGLHRKRLNGVYYIDDKAATPADVHHQRGMHCVDCHTASDTMGDGFLYKRMEDAVEMSCESCHGTWTDYATLLTKRGNKLPQLERQGADVWLTSRVTGKAHRVKQARDVVRPGSKDYNARAALAMTGDHGKLECYSCHSGWNPNFFGFHFDRNEAFTQLDILSGNRTEGRVTTQEKVFSTFKHFYLGWNSHGRIAPYMVGFSSMATVHAEDGELTLDQALPVTKKGLSGMTMIHHQTHTTTARARACVECHRSATTYGRGSVNFRLARDFVVTGGQQGLKLVSLDRKSPADSALICAVGIADVRALAIIPDRLQGHARYVVAASPTEGLVVASTEIPGFPRVVERAAGMVEDPQRLLVADDVLYVADGKAGLRVIDISTPSKPRQIAHLDGLPSYDLHLDGPKLFVAAGAKGLVILDVRRPEDPSIVLRGLDLNGSDTATVDVRRISMLFQYRPPNPDELAARRSRPRRLAALGTARRGIWLLDATEPHSPFVLMKIGNGAITDLELATVYELGSEGGAIPTQERDLLFATSDNAFTIFDVTDPTDMASAQAKGRVPLGAGTRSLHVVRVYTPPFLQTYAVVAGEAGLRLIDASRPTNPTLVVTVPGTGLGWDVGMEEFPLDRTVDSTGSPIMDISHEGARWLSQAELLRVLSMPLLDLDSEPAPKDDADDGSGGRKR
jgi:hypothetical protein